MRSYVCVWVCVYTQKYKYLAQSILKWLTSEVNSLEVTEMLVLKNSEQDKCTGCVRKSMGNTETSIIQQNTKYIAYHIIVHFSVKGVKDTCSLVSQNHNLFPFSDSRKKKSWRKMDFPWPFFSDNRNILKSLCCKHAISAVVLRTSLAKGKCLFRGLEIYSSQSQLRETTTT